jgi:putative membrane protein insertion efficiency factor
MIYMKKGQEGCLETIITPIQNLVENLLDQCCGTVSAASGIATIYNPKRTTRIIRMLIKMDFISLVNYYQAEIEPEMKRRLHVKRICRYHPTCSEYTKAAIKKHGSFLGVAKGAFRILRCNPLSKGGYDPA